MYELHLLGWHSFQQLCHTILREVLGQTVESYLDSNDAGRDGAFTGEWNQSGKESLSGKFVFQCKYTSQISYNLKLSDLKQEFIKVESLVAKGLCDCYILITNAGISGRTASLIENKFKSLGIKNFLLLSSTWIVQQITENKRLRMLVPRVYGLGDLSQIIDERAYSQARALLESMKEDLAKVVVTGAYQRAAEALDKHGFVLLIGEPAAGKTTIASLLAMAALDQWGSFTLKVDDPSKVIEHWNPEDPSQFFWIDDAFGVTQYEYSLANGWNHKLPQIKSMLRLGAKIVMTSRDYIYNRARKDLKESAFPLLLESQVVIDVHNLTLNEKSQILYNHLKLGKQPLQFRAEIKPYLEGIALSERFIPETARRISDPIFTKNLYIGKYFLDEFVNKQESILNDILHGLDKHTKAALSVIYMNNGSLASPIKLKILEQEALERLGSSLGECTLALESIKNSLVQFVISDETTVWKFKHPTIGDAFSNLLMVNPELIEIYLEGSDIEKLMEQVTCGNVGLERAFVIPKHQFPSIIHRLTKFTTTKRYKTDYLSVWGAKDRLFKFLTYRCSKDFLSLYLKSYPNLLDDVSNPGLYLDSVEEVGLALRLNEFGLLPEKQRKIFIETVSKYALSGRDTYALHNNMRSIFSDTEFNNLRAQIRTRLIPTLGVVIKGWCNDFDKNQSAEDYFQPFIESLYILENEFAEDKRIVSKILSEKAYIESWIEENTQEEDELPSRDILGDLGISRDASDARSIFDDIDSDI